MLARTALLAALLAAASPPALPQSASWKPERNVEIVVGVSAGGGIDRTARLIQKILQDQQLIDATSTVVNKPGGGGTIAFAYLNQRQGDAHAWEITATSLLTNHILGTSPLNYTHFTPVSVLYGEYIGFAVNAEGPYKTGRDVIARMKSAPESVSFAFGTSAGNANHIGIALALKEIGRAHV